MAVGWDWRRLNRKAKEETEWLCQLVVYSKVFFFSILTRICVKNGRENFSEHFKVTIWYLRALKPTLRYTEIIRHCEKADTGVKEVHLEFKSL